MRISDWSSDVCSADLGAEHHSRTIFKLWQWRTMGDGMIDADWFARRLTRFDDTDGDIDQLASRIAAVRTLCFIAQRGDWIADAAGWTQRTLDLETRLSDALHAALAQRFVDRRLALLRSEEHTSELQSLMRISYAVFCLNKKINNPH